MCRLGCHVHLNPMSKEIGEEIFSWGLTLYSFSMKFALHDLYKIISYKIESYKSNGFRRIISIGSQSSTNPLKILWIKGVLIRLPLVRITPRRRYQPKISIFRSIFIFQIFLLLSTDITRRIYALYMESTKNFALSCRFFYLFLEFRGGYW
jgi:hypothetical protein